MLSNQPEQRPRKDDLEGGPTTDRQCAAPDEAPCLDEALVVSADQRSTSPFLFIPVGSDQYPKALAAFGKATTEPETLVPYLWQRFRDKVASGGSVAIDFAAGAEGRHLHLLLDAGFSKVYAGDCDPASCAALRRAFSDSKVSVIQDDILAMDPPEAVDAGLLIHVGYPSHVDAKAWPRYIRHCMETLAPGGQLFVVLAHHVAGSFTTTRQTARNNRESLHVVSCFQGGTYEMACPLSIDGQTTCASPLKRLCSSRLSGR